MKKLQQDFLLNAIRDTQDTIRALDRKLAVVAVIVLLPVGRLDVIYGVLMKLDRADCRSRATAAVAVVCWLLSALALITGTAGIDNPAAHVKSSEAKGLYYRPARFALDVRDLFRNRRKHRIEDLSVPETEDGLLGELVFEHAKLAYIRTLKMYRTNACIALIVAWIAAGAATWLVALRG